MVVDGPDDAVNLLVLGWGSTWGHRLPCTVLRARGRDVAKAHLIHLNPFPPNP